MQWTEAIDAHVRALSPVKTDMALLRRIYSLIDLTSLNDNDTESSIAEMCEKAQSSLGHVAGVCVFQSFIPMIAANFSGSQIKTVGVANFPEGENSLENVLAEISQNLQAGAQEIDVVFPYQRYLAGEQQYAHQFVNVCKSACGDNVKLKVILETGALQDPAIIADAAYEALAAGADFIKTSTGKISEGATLEAAAAMLMVIKHTEPQIKHRLGFKASGGIRTIEQAAQYVELADRIMGGNWVTPATFRIGASKLVDEILSGV
ncbi:MAG TPA: deoxyribose-phosphate aldolase [Gammaproteobacteria bacterium]|jgi:deoxyribose-phosphate aldolase|nr:deoxyribose-phosphate aldolase [Gammaproteobacteria bacterium]